MMVDLTAVDWYRKREPRFQLVVNFLSVSKNSRIILNVNVQEEELKVPEFSNPEAAGAVILLEDVFASFLAISKSNSTEPEPAVSTPSDCSEIIAESRSLLALLFLTKTFS